MKRGNFESKYLFQELPDKEFSVRGVYTCTALFSAGLINLTHCNAYLGWLNIITGHNKNCKAIYSYNLVANVVLAACDIEYSNIYMHLTLHSVFIIS